MQYFSRRCRTTLTHKRISQCETENLMCETQVCKYSMFHTLQHQQASAKIEIKLHAMTTNDTLYMPYPSVLYRMYPL